MDIDSALSAFYRHNGFGPVTGPAPSTVDVFIGCLLVPLPNIEARRTYLKYHDIHHIITTYGVGRIGEGEVCAWELGTGSTRYPVIALMNLVTLSTGFILAPRRVYRAFRYGCRCTSLYAPEVRADIDRGAFADIEQVRRSVVEICRRKYRPRLQMVEFCAYITIALLIHIVLVFPSLGARVITEKIFHLGLIKKSKL